METVKQFFAKHFQDLKTRRERDFAHWYVDGFLVIPPEKVAPNGIKKKCRELFVYEISASDPTKPSLNYKKVKFCLREIPESNYTEEFLQNLRTKKMPFEWELALHSKMVNLAKRKSKFKI